VLIEISRCGGVKGIFQKRRIVEITDRQSVVGGVYVGTARPEFSGGQGGIGDRGQGGEDSTSALARRWGRGWGNRCGFAAAAAEEEEA